MRDDVLPGSMAYSAVSQPIDFPSRNGGTVSARLAVTRTAVSPHRYSTLPGLLRTNPRSMVTGRSWAGLRSFDRIMRRVIHFCRLSLRERLSIMNISFRGAKGDTKMASDFRFRSSDVLLAQQPGQDRHLKMEPVGRLSDHLAAWTVEDFRGHLFTPRAGRQ